MAIRVCPSATQGCKSIIDADDELNVSEYHGPAFGQFACAQVARSRLITMGWHVTCGIVGRPLNAKASRRARKGV
jgi:hypothetical protein